MGTILLTFALLFVAAMTQMATLGPNWGWIGFILWIQSTFGWVYFMISRAL